MRKLAAATLVVLVAVTGCTVMDFGSSDQTGSISGGLVNTPSSASNQKIVVSVTGASLGSLLSARVKEKLNQRDRENVDSAADRSFRKGERVEWSNQKTGRRGYVQPGRIYKATSGNLCRDFTNTILYKDREDVVNGTACQNEDGTWQIVS